MQKKTIDDPHCVVSYVHEFDYDDETSYLDIRIYITDYDYLDAYELCKYIMNKVRREAKLKGDINAEDFKKIIEEGETRHFEIALEDGEMTIYYNDSNKEQIAKKYGIDLDKHKNNEWAIPIKDTNIKIKNNKN